MKLLSKCVGLTKVHSPKFLRRIFHAVEVLNHDTTVKQRKRKKNRQGEI